MRHALLFLLTAACQAPQQGVPVVTSPPADSGDTAAEDLSDPLFDPDHVLEIDLQLDADDWETIRHQRRNIVQELSEDCEPHQIESPYEYFPAQVTVDGQLIELVGLRKKGLLGSESARKPSLKIDMDQYVDDQRFLGKEMLTLNNARQDPSFLHQCLGYGLFSAAGVPAPRCSFAHVTLNGQDMGLYVHIESLKEDFLELHFGSSSGSHYEGALSDFREGWLDSFEGKDDSNPEDRSDLQAVIDALDLDDDQLLAQLDQVLDVDAFLTYWAMEVLTGHWDSYTGNRNNFHVYADPADGRFHFLPWGADAVLQGEEPFGADQPTAVVANSALARRLYLLDETRDLYENRLRELLDTVWDADAWLAEAQRMDALVSPYLTSDYMQENRPAYQEEVFRYISERKAQVEAEIADGMPSWEAELGDYPCLITVGQVQASFSTAWDSANSQTGWSESEAELTVDYYDSELGILSDGAIAGLLEDDYSEEVFLGLPAYISFNTIIYPYLTIDPHLVEPGTTLEVDWQGVRGYLGYIDGSGVFYTLGYLWEGQLVLEQAALEEGGTISGTLSVPIWGAEQ